jgi:hypothetical protein
MPWATMYQSREANLRSPQDGDVLVTRVSHSPATFTVLQLPGTLPQLSAHHRTGAVAFARSFAEKYSVDVWYREEETYRLLHVYRKPAS